MQNIVIAMFLFEVKMKLLDERQMRWVFMEFELKDFEDKINDITEQFMSLLEENEKDSEKAKFDGTSNASVGSEGVDSDLMETINHFGEIAYKFGSQKEENEEKTEHLDSIPAHAIRFDEVDDLNKRLEDLYQTRKFDLGPSEDEPKLSFADYGICSPEPEPQNSGNTNDKINSVNEKEDNTMANYNNKVNDEGSIFSFATVPQERALASKRTFSDVLFMDIPWDTKVDIWGGFKAFFNTDVKFTF